MLVVSNKRFEDLKVRKVITWNQIQLSPWTSILTRKAVKTHRFKYAHLQNWRSQRRFKSHRLSYSTKVRTIAIWTYVFDHIIK